MFLFHFFFENWKHLFSILYCIEMKENGNTLPCSLSLKPGIVNEKQIFQVLSLSIFYQNLAQGTVSPRIQCTLNPPVYPDCVFLYSSPLRSGNVQRNR